MNAAAGQIKRGRKFDQVLEGAQEVFMRDGFEGASVDDIARAAGVSKATLYSYFPDKRLLFMEVATGQCQRQADECIQAIDPELPPGEVLRGSAERMMGFYLSEFGRAVFRIVVAETERFPGLGREFWEAGPAKSRDVLIDYFHEANARKKLRVPDAELAADQFTELCKVDLHPRLLMGLCGEVSEAERDRVATGAVEMFLARYGV
ncbi:TetR/AcrR family transcriptional regulator [Tropicimonas sp. TH_r6]|uniref:TetR/AcrR family transcriptional regulator n=1 Tax=Tropicimonas sp. TH_r6 TaxID=3082085 RepID=UPI002952DBAA|nr:TetR/AcrR family transcriptional regulator [Tropicimonas sp. TH_r6]MDV7144732.1 TetR/AcrR family transcriptional regulator [Tropicimonas sp. TH_r6]